MRGLGLMLRQAGVGPERDAGPPQGTHAHTYTMGNLATELARMHVFQLQEETLTTEAGCVSPCGRGDGIQVPNPGGER